MITLDPTLQSAQDALIRAPICRINSSSFVEAIPFDGNYFNTSPIEEQHPYLIETSSGRLAMVLSSAGNLIYRVSDAAKIQFTDTTIVTGASYNPIYEAALVEISPAVIGIIYSCLYSASVLLRRITITETGSIISAPESIAAYANTFNIREVCVIEKQTGGFLAVYRKTDLQTTDQYLMRRTSTDFLSWSSEANTGI
jgi:hypothetical protein